MGVKFRPCDLEGCCKQDRYGDSTDPPASRGDRITAESREECKSKAHGKGKDGIGISCLCFWIKHYTKQGTDGWQVTDEKFHDGVRWSDEATAEL